ncbi:MAG: thiamine phosphate synthase [Mangrovibacterium sp.]
MQLYLISHNSFFKGEELVVSELLDRYDFTFHLRKPGASNDEYESFLNKIPRALHAKIMIHEAYELIDKFELKGLHFSTMDRNFRSNFPANICSTSAHSLNELKGIERQYDYQFLSPIFPSISKPGYIGKLKPVDIKNYLKTKRTNKTIALGGINENNINILKLMGFDGVAVLGSVWGNKPENVTEIVNRFEKIWHSISL